MARIRVFLVFTFSLLLVASAFPQKKKLEKADKAFEAGEYYIAIDLYKDAFSSVRDKNIRAEIYYQVAECYRITNQSAKAELWYKKAIRLGYESPQAILAYADALKKNENYVEAIVEYKRYKQLVPDDPRGNDGIYSSELALQWIDNPSGYIVEEIRTFNSRQSDFSPAFARNDYTEVFFTSSREESIGNKTHGATGENYADIYSTKMDRKGKWSVPVPLDENINSEFDEGAPSFNKEFTEMYFTRCVVTKRKKMGCQIYFTRRTGGSWNKPELISIAEDSIVVAHPALSSDGLTLYFTSNMEDGFGGKDLWKITRASSSGTWSKPENLGSSINTEMDELFPYIHPDGTLYFSSNGQIGMGGLDIFKANLNEQGEWILENMRHPVNSFADDFGITFQSDEEKGFFSSTRKGRGNDDIFSFVLPPMRFNMLGVVRDEKTEESIPGARVKLIGSDGVTLENDTEQDGTFRFMLKPNTDYIFLASAEGYLNGKDRETTKGQEKSRDFRTTIFLASIEKPIELSNSNVFYDFARWDLRPEALVSLDRLVETLTDNPNVTIELMSHTDSRDTEAFNLDLSQKRAQSVVDYLIAKGIATQRLTARGYGESSPKVVTKRLSEDFIFLKEGDTLTEGYINGLETVEQKEIAHQINRRTEFRVLSTDYNGDSGQIQQP